jgi:hypothetical protein
MFGDIQYIEELGPKTVLSFEGTLLHDIDEARKGTRVEVRFDRRGELLMRPVDAGSDSKEAGADDSFSEYSFGFVLGPKHTFVNCFAQGSAWCA